MKIGKYEIVEELGRGAMGVVYRARDPLLDRDVAIKLVSTENVDELTKPLFEREAKAVARMSHPNIVVVHEFDYFENEPYIVMELLKGSDLESIMSSDGLNLTRALKVIHETLSGLQHAHERGVIHRDIKPTNIFVTDANVVKILDFGVARLATSSTVTEGFILGTPEYMSPEQVKSETLDGRSDLFSVGSVLYWLFTGQSPFTADTAEATMLRIVREEPRPMDVAGASHLAHSGLLSILNRALAKDPADRFSSAAEMAKEVEDLMSILEQESELQAQDPDLDYMETLQVEYPKSWTTTKKSGSIPQPPPVEDSAPKQTEEKVTSEESEPQTIEKTLLMRASVPPPVAPPPSQAAVSENAAERPEPSVAPETVEPPQPRALTSRNILILLIAFLAIVALIVLGQCR